MALDECKSLPFNLARVRKMSSLAKFPSQRVSSFLEEQKYLSSLVWLTIPTTINFYLNLHLSWQKPLTVPRSTASSSQSGHSHPLACGAPLFCCCFSFNFCFCDGVKETKQHTDNGVHLEGQHSANQSSEQGTWPVDMEWMQHDVPAWGCLSLRLQGESALSMVP